MTISDTTPQDKRPILETALAAPTEPNHQIVIQKAMQRGWLTNQAKVPQESTSLPMKTAAVGTGIAEAINPLSIPHGVEILGGGIGRTLADIAYAATHKDSGGVHPLENLAQSEKESITPELSAMGGLKTVAPDFAAALPKNYVTGGEVAGLAGSILFPEQIGKVFEKAGIGAARKALGFNKSLIKQVGGVEEANQAAKRLLKEGTIGAFQNAEEIASKVADTKATAGETIGKVLNAIDDTGQVSIDATALQSSMKGAKISKRFTSDVNTLKDIPALGELKAPLENALATVESIAGGEGTLTLAQAQELKNIFNSAADFAKNTDSAKELLARKMVTIVGDAIDRAVKDSSKISGFEQMSTDYQAAKEIYGAASKVEMSLTDAILRKAGNRSIGPMDAAAVLMGEVAGMKTGHPMGGGLYGLIAKKALEGRGWSTLANAAQLGQASIRPVGLAKAAILPTLSKTGPQTPAGQMTP